MNVLLTPRKTRPFVWGATCFILASPVVVTAHFALRLLRGDYPWDADAIGIPVFSYLMLVFPLLLLFLRRGLRAYVERVSILNWNRRRFGWSLMWTLLLLFPAGWFHLLMLVDGMEGRFYPVAAYFVVQFYLLVLMRACIVREDGRRADPSLPATVETSPQP